MFSAPVPLPCTSVISSPPLSPRYHPYTRTQRCGRKTPVATQRPPHQRAASLIFQLLGQRNARSSAASSPIRADAKQLRDRRHGRDGATRRADDSGPSTNVGSSTVEKSAMTQPPPQQPPTQVFAQQ